MYKVRNLSPMLPSHNVGATVGFFTELFEFKVLRDNVNYVIVYKDNYLIHILNAGLDIGEMEFYLEVEGIDELWQKIENNLTELKTKPPFNQPYGMREFHVIVPHTKTLMFVGQVI